MIVRILLRGLLVCSAFAPTLHAIAEVHHRDRILLEKPWSFRQLNGDGITESESAHPPSMEGGWMDATVPGDVHLDLLKNGKIQDPFYRDNEASLQWIEKAAWEYRMSIDATEKVLNLILSDSLKNHSHGAKGQQGSCVKVSRQGS